MTRGDRAKEGRAIGWLDRVKQSMEKAAEEAEDMAAIGKLKLEIRTLNGKMEDAFKSIGAKVYDLSEARTSFPTEIMGLCREADKLADEVKAKETEIAKIKAEA